MASLDKRVDFSLKVKSGHKRITVKFLGWSNKQSSKVTSKSACISHQGSLVSGTRDPGSENGRACGRVRVRERSVHMLHASAVTTVQRDCFKLTIDASIITKLRRLVEN